MSRYVKSAFVGGLFLLASPLAAEQPEMVTDAEAYALYSLLVPPVWNRQTMGTNPILLQRETESPHTHGCGNLSAPNAEWLSVVADFNQQNARVQLLHPLLRPDAPHRLIPRAEIEADDARLAVKYPGGYQRRPESMDYVAVSAVGFNREKTKAIVYVRLRSQGNTYFMEKRNGTWVRAKVPQCGWIA